MKTLDLFVSISILSVVRVSILARMLTTGSPPSPRDTNAQSGKVKKGKPRFLSSKNWLLKHGLRAKKLLLLDALSEAIVKDRTGTKLDTQIISRLLDEVF